MIDQTIMKLPGMKKVLSLLAGLSILQAFFIIGQAYSISETITGFWGHQNLNHEWPWIISFFIFYSCRHFITFIRSNKLNSYSNSMADDFRKKLLQKVFRLGPQIVQHTGTGNMTTMALDGIDQVQNYLNLILAKIMNMMIIPWLILLFIFYLDWISGVTLLIVFPIIIIFMIVLGYAAQSKADRQYAAYQILSNHFIDSLRGIDTLKLFGLSKKYAKSIFDTSERFRKATMSTLRVAILSTFALDFFTTISIAIVAVLSGLRLVDEHITLLPALTVLILSPEYFLPIRNFSSDYHATLDGKNALKAINEVLNYPEPQIENVHLESWNEDSQLNVSNLTLNYDHKVGLNKISFAAKGYQKIGVIGVSGSGKSTLINVLSGFLTPQNADIIIQNHKIESFKQHDWEKQLIYIPQDPYIFQLTLRENVAFYKPNASIDEINEAIEVAGLKELVNELPDGIDTKIGEGARTLSGGQAQRIALARAFLDKKRKVMLFDEPTAHLDIETEVELKQRMLPLMENRLVFFATHRLHWMKNMDYILVIDKGQIVEQGTLKELQQKNGAFVKLTKQMRGE